MADAGGRWLPNRRDVEESSREELRRCLCGDGAGKDFYWDLVRWNIRSANRIWTAQPILSPD